MQIEVRAIEPGEYDEQVAVIDSAFHEHRREEQVELDRRLIEFDRSFSAFVGGRMVGMAATASFNLSMPGGGEAPMAGVTAAGVAPTHRRRGVATALMRHQLDHIRDREEPVAGLFASEGAIYGRFGYGVATYSCGIEVDPAGSAFIRERPERGEMRLLPREEALHAMEPIFDAFRAGQPGVPDRPGAWWEATFEDFEADREGASAYHYAIHRGPRGSDAYAVYRFKHEWPDEIPAGEVQVAEVVATSPGARAAIWRYLFDLDLAGRVKARNQPPDDPLLVMLVAPRHLRLVVRDGMWLRLVDVPKALMARTYSAEGTLVLEVDDPFCPWNTGRIALEAGPDGADVRPSRRTPDLRLGAPELGQVLLGGTRFGQLARASRVDEVRSGAVVLADAMFTWDPGPWCPGSF